jgi:RpiB/LacA/LacB family sugar-phosphate isomerase
VQIAIGSDQAGHELKQQLKATLSAAGHQLSDVAPQTDTQWRPDYAEQVAIAVLRGDAERGIIVCGRGVGASLAANRVPGIRAALCNHPHPARLGAAHDGMNVLVLSSHVVDAERARQVVTAYLEAALAPVEVVGGLSPRRLQQVFFHVRENISRDLTVQELAQVAGMSQYYFSKLFKLSTGTTPHQYVMRHRVERAQQLLRDGRVALAEVSAQVGFETQSHFTSVFRKIAGTTPKRYRDLNQTNPNPETPNRERKATAA